MYIIISYERYESLIILSEYAICKKETIELLNEAGKINPK